jgi:hypothetical protein
LPLDGDIGTRAKTLTQGVAARSSLRGAGLRAGHGKAGQLTAFQVERGEIRA